jgi:hypothetical protein
MSTPNSRLSERVAIVAAIDPQIVDGATVYSDYVDMSKFDRILAVVQVGDTEAVVDAEIQTAQDAADTGVADLDGKAITQLTAAGGDNKQAAIELRAAEMPSGHQFARLKVTVASTSTGAFIAGLVIGGDAREKPASDNDVASVAEIVD